MRYLAPSLLFADGHVDDDAATSDAAHDAALPAGLVACLDRCRPDIDAGGPASPFHGQIDDVRIYDRALSDDER